MKAIGYQHNLPVENQLSLQDIELDIPIAKGDDILVEVKAVSVNSVDFKVRQTIPAPESEYKVLGYDATGVVKSAGENVTLFKPGDKVWYAGDMQQQHDILNNIANMIDKGQIKTTVGENLGLINATNLRKAHQHLETQTVKGKLVLVGF